MEEWRKELYHYGVKGMRWGVRRTPEQLGHRPSNTQRRALKIKAGVESYFRDRKEAKKRRADDKKAKAERRNAADKRRTLTDEEIRKRIERIRLERQFKDLVDEDVAPGRKFVSDLLIQSGKKALSVMTTGAMLYAVKVALTQKVDSTDAANYITPRPKNK